MLATPYFQKRYDNVPSTQDVARGLCESLPVLVIASSQTRGRGRSGVAWDNAERALAVSLAVRVEPDAEQRPLSLMAGVAAVRATDTANLKWPNDVLVPEGKVGGILVEQSAGVSVIGLGLNLFWPEAPEGSASLYDFDPGPEAHVEIAALWGAELMVLLRAPGWPIDDYREVCSTLGANVTWEPDGQGVAVDVAPDGSLIVETSSGTESIYSGAVRHVRLA